MEELSKRLAADLRKHIRALGPCEVLSERWVEVGDCLSRISSISQMEKTLPKEAEASLWDCEELALRYVLEDGKLNLCLRLLDEFQQYMVEADKEGRDFSPEDFGRLQRFGKGVGGLFVNAWLHVEALQTSDLPLVAQITSTAMRRALAKPAADFFEGSLPACAVHFLYAMARSVEAVGERKVYAALMPTECISLLIQHLHANFDKFRPADVQKGAEALALFAASEDFATHLPRILASGATAASLLALEALCLPFLSVDADARRKFRPLTDLFAQTKRRK